MRALVKIECDTILPSPSAVTEAGKTGDPYARTFFQKEYTLNHLIGNIMYNATTVIHLYFTCVYMCIIIQELSRSHL